MCGTIVFFVLMLLVLGLIGVSPKMALDACTTLFAWPGIRVIVVTLVLMGIFSSLEDLFNKNRRKR